MSLENTFDESDYDQSSLADKHIRMKLLCSHKGGSTPSRLHRQAAFDADNITRLIRRGLSYLGQDSVDCAMDVGCGGGNLCRVMIESKLVSQTIVGTDKSKKMIEYAKLTNDDIAHYEFLVLDAAISNDEFSQLLKNMKFPLIYQTYMLCHAKDVNQLSQILFNIASVCNGIFVGLIQNPFWNYKSKSVEKLSKYGIKFTWPKEDQGKMKDGMKYQSTFEEGTPNELTLTDHWYTAETYERLFKEAGFKMFEWCPLQLDRYKDEEYLLDLIDSNYLIGFIASI